MPGLLAFLRDQIAQIPNSVLRLRGSEHIHFSKKEALAARLIQARPNERSTLSWQYFSTAHGLCQIAPIAQWMRLLALRRICVRI